MTRSWYALSGGEPFAVAGLWSPNDIWGACYTMVMVPSCAQMAQVHDRMPVILAREDWKHWMAREPREALNLCRTWNEQLVYEPTTEPFSLQRAHGAGNRTATPPTPPEPDDRQLPLF
jgi:putative SOS response-associated peptidase YedK